MTSMGKETHIKQWLVSVLFLLMVISPLALWLFIEDSSVSVSEKRRLAEAPSLPTNVESLQEFPRQFETYFNDHFGLRDKLVHYNNLLMYKLFGVSSNPLVLIGDDGWLFFSPDGLFYDYMGLKRYDALHLELHARLLEDRSDWLASMGGHYLFVPVPNKVSVYSEFLPSRIRKYRSEDVYDKLVAKLKADSTFKDFIDSKQLLLEEKKSNQVYYRTDTHWNQAGAYAVYKRIIEHMQKNWFPDLSPVQLMPPKALSKSVSGDLSYMVNLQNRLIEKVPESEVINDCAVREKQVYTAIADIGEYADLNFNSYPKVSGCSVKTRKAVVINDSFGEHLHHLLSQHFNIVYYSNFLEFNDLSAFIKHEKPDVVIDLRVARNFNSALVYNPEIEQTVLLNKQSQFNDTRMQITPQSLKDHLEKADHLQIDNTADGLRLRSQSNYPTLIFQFDAGQRTSPLVINIKLSSQQRTDMILYYTSESDMAFSALQSITRPVRPGLNEMIFRLPTPNPGGKIKFHPGAKKGEYILHSFTVKRSNVIVH